MSQCRGTQEPGGFGAELGKGLFPMLKTSIRLSASVLPLLAVPAMAQQSLDSDQPNKGSETILVTARRSMDAPVEEIKRNSPVIVDTITAEQIDKTPDITLAEALDRVVGVSSDGFFSSSDPGTVTIRGLRPLQQHGG